VADDEQYRQLRADLSDQREFITSRLQGMQREMDQRFKALSDEMEVRRTARLAETESAARALAIRIDTAEMHFNEKFTTKETMYLERLNALRGEMRQTSDMHMQAAKLRADCFEQVTKVATETMDKRLQGMNEFRASLSDQAARFVTRDEIKDQISPLAENLTKMELRATSLLTREEGYLLVKPLTESLQRGDTRSANLDGRFWALGAGITVVVVIVNIAIGLLSALRPSAGDKVERVERLEQSAPAPTRAAPATPR
jgi:hypothetical protein